MLWVFVLFLLSWDSFPPARDLLYRTLCQQICFVWCELLASFVYTYIFVDQFVHSLLVTNYPARRVQDREDEMSEYINSRY
jgi:hypothetical protein